VCFLAKIDGLENEVKVSTFSLKSEHTFHPLLDRNTTNSSSVREVFQRKSHRSFNLNRSGQHPRRKMALLSKPTRYEQANFVENCPVTIHFYSSCPYILSSPTIESSGAEATQGPRPIQLNQARLHQFNRFPMQQPTQKRRQILLFN